MPNEPITLTIAFVLGLSHSLEPSHAKSVLASYFLNQKRSVREALYFALTVTVAHTLTIYGLALMGFVLGPSMKSESVEIWGEFLGGVLLIAISLWMFISEVRAHFHQDEDRCDHHQCKHDHAHGHFFHHHDFNHDHPKPTPKSSMKQIFVLGFCSGMVPCLNGLVVLLQAWSAHSPAYGLLLVSVFSLGLGGVVLVMCLTMRTMAQWMDLYWKKAAAFSRLLPILSAFLIFGMGIYILWEVIPEIIGK